MKNAHLAEEQRIHPEMTVLEVVDLYPSTEAVFRKYDQQAGVCLCCMALFEPLRQMAEKYNLNLKMLLDDLESFARANPENSNFLDSPPENRSLGDRPNHER
jgi:hypothetical protein